MDGGHKPPPSWGSSCQAFPPEHREQGLGVGPADPQGGSVNAGPTDLHPTAGEAWGELPGAWPAEAVPGLSVSPRAVHTTPTCVVPDKSDQQRSWLHGAATDWRHQLPQLQVKATLDICSDRRLAGPRTALAQGGLPHGLPPATHMRSVV